MSPWQQVSCMNSETKWIAKLDCLIFVILNISLRPSLCREGWENCEIIEWFNIIFWITTCHFVYWWILNVDNNQKPTWIPMRLFIDPLVSMWEDYCIWRGQNCQVQRLYRCPNKLRSHTPFTYLNYALIRINTINYNTSLR